MSGKYQENLGHVREIYSFIKISGNCQGNLVHFCTVREMSGTSDLNHHFPPLCHYLFCETYMIERSREYQINDERNVCPTCKRAFPEILEGVNSKNFSRSACVVSASFLLHE